MSGVYPPLQERTSVLYVPIIVCAPKVALSRKCMTFRLPRLSFLASYQVHIKRFTVCAFVHERAHAHELYDLIYRFSIHHPLLIRNRVTILKIGLDRALFVLRSQNPHSFQ